MNHSPNNQCSQKLDSQQITDNLDQLDSAARDQLANYANLGLALTIDRIKLFFELAEEPRSDDELLLWLNQCARLRLITQTDETEGQASRWEPSDEVRAYFLSQSNTEDMLRYNLAADAYLLEVFAALAEELDIPLPEGESRRTAIIGPGQFLDQISHLPEYQDLHHQVLNLAVNWFDHLYRMEEYRQAADVLFHTCFALARRGQTAMAENMLAAIAAKAQDLPGVVAQVNLATLLRQEYKLSAALRLYRKSILKLLNLRAFIQLAQVLSEIAVIHRQMGHLGRSVIFLESSAALNHFLKNHTSAAIAHSQLSSTYRYLKMYGLAARNSKLAICHFRQRNDFLNLGRSLLTQGNIYFNQHKAKQALHSFNEAYEIGLRIADPQAEIGAVSGKARVFIFQNRYDEAQELLEQAISLRERHNDHTVGIEYQNMAVLYEKRGNFAMSLGWYQKALTQFEKYMPVEVPVCKRQIALAQKKYRK